MNKWSEWYHFKDEISIYNHIKTRKVFGKEIFNVRFSIVIPMYKRFEHLKEALNSAVNQDILEPYEIAIFDNELNASGEKLKIIKEFTNSFENIVYYQNDENLGMFGNFNRSIAMAKGEWVVVLHDDDMLKNNYLSKMSSLIDNKIAIISPHPEILDSRENQKKKKNSKLSKLMNLFNGLKPVYLYDFLHISGISQNVAVSISYSLPVEKNKLFDEYFRKYSIDDKYRNQILLKFLKSKNSFYVFKRLLRKRK